MPGPPDTPWSGTLADPDDDNRPPGPGGATPTPPPPAAGTVTAVRPYRPTRRPPVPLLTVMDDGQSTGEVIRIRGTRFVIGRTEGDLLLPADEMVSVRHAEIACQKVPGGYRWVVIDLQSRNGLWLRVHRRILRDGDEFLVGQGRYRFDLPAGAGQGDTADFTPGDAGGTRGWDAALPVPLGPLLTEMTSEGTAARVPLRGSECWVGREPGCTVCRAQDPYTAPRHIKLTRDPQGSWKAENQSPAGLWLRVSQAAERDIQFQIGEQRFRLTVPA